MRKTADQRRREIVEAVLRLSAEVGPDRLGTSAVARAVGLTQPAIFRHFPTTEDLWVAVAEHVAAELRLTWGAVPVSPAGPEGALRALVRAHMDEVAREPAILAIVFSHELRVANERLAVVFRGLMAELGERLATLAAAFGERLRVGHADAARLLLALVQGTALRWSLSGRGFDLAGEVDRLLDLQLCGLLWPSSEPDP